LFDVFKNNPDKILKLTVRFLIQTVFGTIPFSQQLRGFHDNTPVAGGMTKSGAQLDAKGDQFRFNAAEVEDIPELANLGKAQARGIKAVFTSVLITSGSAFFTY